MFRDAGSNVLGLDFDDEFLDIARARQINVKLGSTEVLNANDKYDLIILSHVLEHIVEPTEFLKKVIQFLSDDGLIYIEVPSVDRVADGAYSYDLLNYFQNAHTIHFTTKTLAMICKSIGLCPLYQTNFIESCWAKCDVIEEFSAAELSDSVNFSEELVNLAEQRRSSFKAVVQRYKQKIKRVKRVIGGILNRIGMKSIINKVVRKFQV